MEPHPQCTPLRVFLVEDSELVRQRIEAELASIPGLLAVGHAASADEAIDAILLAHPDVVLLDLRLRAGNGMNVLRALHASAPEIDVYLCSSYAGEPYRGMALRLGAAGVFDKSTEFDRVKEVLALRAASLH